MDIHNSAAKGFSVAAGTYVRGRPDYPVEAVTWLREDLNLGPKKSVLEVGAGTGKFLPILRQTGAQLLALEPVAAMRAQLIAAHDDVTTLAGSAASIPLPDGAVDAVVCAQAFHWFATPEVLAEFRRVLAPGGMLGLIWNVRDETVPWVAALSGIISPLEGDTPRYGSGAWRKLFPADGFCCAGERRVPYVHRGRPEDVILRRILSVSFVAAQPAAAQQDIAEKINQLIRQTPSLAGASDVVFPYETRMFTYRKSE